LPLPFFLLSAFSAIPLEPFYVSDAEAKQKTAATGMSVEAYDTVLLRLNDGEDIFVEVVPQRSVRIKKSSFFADALIGATFGSVWEVGSGKEPLTLVPSGILIPTVDVGLGEMSGDNRGYSDKSSAQAMSQDDISRLKSEGADGTAVVAALARSSTTFAEKNALTQEKWLKKRTLKHVVRFRVVLPAPAAITEVLLARDADRIGRLRWDSLAHALCLANVREGCTAVVCDGTGGLLTGAAAHRMGCSGRILAPHPDSMRGPAVGLAIKFNLGRVGRLAAAAASATAVSPPDAVAAAAPKLAAAETLSEDPSTGLLSARAPSVVECGAASPAAAACVADLPPQKQRITCSGNDHGGRFQVIGAPYSSLLQWLEGLPASDTVSGAVLDAAATAAAAALPAPPVLPAMGAEDEAAGSAVSVSGGLREGGDDDTLPAAPTAGDQACVAPTRKRRRGGGEEALVAEAAAAPASEAQVGRDEGDEGSDATPAAAAAADDGATRVAAAAAAAVSQGGAADAVAGSSSNAGDGGGAGAPTKRALHELPVCTLPLSLRAAFFIPCSADSCLVAGAADTDPSPLLLRLGLPLLKPSGAFAVFSPYAAVLGTLQATLKARGLAVHVQVRAACG
jgi:hypothetical protein